MITHKEKITVAKIAKESGVSPATVSRVLNHPDLVKEGHSPPCRKYYAGYMFSPSITTISQPKFQEGYSACEMLIEIAGNPEASPKSTLLDTELIIRESTSFLPNTFK